jgi:hypothetical protein
MPPSTGAPTRHFSCELRKISRIDGQLQSAFQVASQANERGWKVIELSEDSFSIDLEIDRKVETDVFHLWNRPELHECRAVPLQKGNGINDLSGQVEARYLSGSNCFPCTRNTHICLVFLVGRMLCRSAASGESATRSGPS